MVFSYSSRPAFFLISILSHVPRLLPGTALRQRLPKEISKNFRFLCLFFPISPAACLFSLLHVFYSAAVCDEAVVFVYPFISAARVIPHCQQYSTLSCSRLHPAMAQDWFSSPPPHPGQYPPICMGHSQQFSPHSENRLSSLVNPFISSSSYCPDLRFLSYLRPYTRSVIPL